MAQESKTGKPPLWQLANQHGMGFGTAINAHAISNDEYRAIVERECDVVVAENAMKFGPLRPQRETWNWEPADRLADFARKNNKRMRGHTLVWHAMNPKWLLEGDFERQEVIDIMREHIFKTVERYKDVIYCWDVVNEAVERTDSSMYHDTYWNKKIGPEHISMAHRYAHEADPKCKLIHNDWVHEGEGWDSDKLCRFVQELQDDNVPVHGVGLQYHFGITEPPVMEKLLNTYDRFASLGLEVHITELDVFIDYPVTDEKLEQQAILYKNVAKAAASHKAVTEFLVWGHTDASHHYQRDKTRGDACLWDEDYNPKPAYYAVADAWS